MTRVRGWVRVGAVAVTVLLAASACDDDKKTASTTTVAETVQQFMDRVQRDCPSFQPAFDDFYSQHPQPVAADYVEFLPTQIDGLQAMASCIEASGPPAQVQGLAGDVVAAMNTVIDDVTKALDAAKADDVAGAEQWLTQMHDTDVAKIDTAIQKVTEAAG